MPLFSRNPNSRSNLGRSEEGSQQLTQPQNTYKRFKISLSCLQVFCRSHRHDTMPHVPGIDITAPGIREPVLDGHKQYASVVSNNPQVLRTPHHDSPNLLASTQAEGRVPLPIVRTVSDHVATQFQGAQGFNISGSPQFTNIGMNTGNLTATTTTVNNPTVNNYGAAHSLESLKAFVSFAALHNSAEQDPYRRCHPGTRENVLRQLRHWIDNPNPADRIFWLYGPAGAGKSAIAQTIAHGYKQGEVAATFFFYRSDAARNDGNRLFTTIAWQLAFSIPAVKDLIVQALDKTPHLPMTNVETQFEQLVAHPTDNITSQIPHLAPVVIIDGVDECFIEQLQRRFLTVIGNAVKDCRVPLRFLICSRPEALIEETLNQFKDFILRIDLATLDDANRDIEKYLVDQFSDIASKQGLDPSWPGQDIIGEIVFKSSGNFILASTLVRYIGDEDHSAVSQLDIVRKLKPHGTMSPFALLDELYLEILKRQPDQDFLKTFLALLVGRNSVNEDLHEDDEMLMNVSEKELHIKLRRMRSLLKFEPFIDVYHKSFLDFLQDPSRSGQYHVSEQGGCKRYLELIVGSVVRHISLAIEHPLSHETCRSDPAFKKIVWAYPPAIDLPVEDWQETLKPLLDLQDKLLETSRPVPCRVAQVMRDLLLQLAVLQRNADCVAATQAPASTKNELGKEWNQALVTEERENTPEKDLDSCLSVLLSCLQELDSVPLVVDTPIIDHMSSLLAFEHAETVARIRFVPDAQRLVDFIGLLNNNETFPNPCGPDGAREAAYLASEIFKRVPLFPCFLLNRHVRLRENTLPLELLLQGVFISRILDHDYIVPVSWIYWENDKYNFDCCNVNDKRESIHRWLERSSPNFVMKIKVMLEVAKTIRYIHSMDIALHSYIFKQDGIRSILLDSNLRAKVLFIGFFTWWVKEALIYGHEQSPFWAECTYESNVSAFADLFQEVCFDGDDTNLSSGLVEDARQVIERCRAKSPPTMEHVVKEMETWKLT